MSKNSTQEDSYIANEEFDETSIIDSKKEEQEASSLAQIVYRLRGRLRNSRIILGSIQEEPSTFS